MTWIALKPQEEENIAARIFQFEISNFNFQAATKKRRIRRLRNPGPSVLMAPRSSSLAPKTATVPISS
jgi:hypothetical protein